jgi:hypothetical protein
MGLCLCLVAASLAAETALSVHERHLCTGAGCPVCLAAQRTEIFARQLKDAAFHSGFRAASLLMCAPAPKQSAFLFIPPSAVRLKVKINS